jgi:8-oxo-dGTP pyrophosphatase MutT (NUDIX family)
MSCTKAGESVFQALRREICEETGLLIGETITELDAIKEYFFDIVTQEPWKSYRSFYLIDIVGGKLLSDGNNDDVISTAIFNVNRTANIKTKDYIRNTLHKLTDNKM